MTELVPTIILGAILLLIGVAVYFVLKYGKDEDKEETTEEPEEVEQNCVVCGVSSDEVGDMFEDGTCSQECGRAKYVAETIVNAIKEAAPVKVVKEIPVKNAAK